MLDTGAIEIVEKAKAELERSVNRLKKALADVPEDKTHWSPAPTARTPLQQVAHCAISVLSIMEWINGKPFDFAELPAMDAQWREEERQYATREAVLELLDENIATYVRWMDSLTPEQANGTIKTEMGEFAMADAMTFNADHIRQHTSQIHYIQTCYGDLDFHMG